MKRILFVSPTASLGGAERVMQTVAEYLVRQGWEVTFYVMSRGDKEGWQELKKYSNFKFIIKNYGSEKTALPALLYNLIFLNKKQNYDYIFSTHSHINATLSFLKKMKLLSNCLLIGRESTVVFQRYYGFSSVFFKILYKYFYGKHDLLVCQTKEMKQSLILAAGDKLAKKIQVIPNPVSLIRIDKCLNDGRTPIDTGFKNIVACGRLVPVKNFPLLIKAFERIANCYDNVHLYIVGEGREREELKKLCDALNMNLHITFTGHQSNPCEWYRIADLGVISSIKEGFPNVLLEMMASGTKAILTTPCTGDLENIPKIKISENHTVDALFSLMKETLLNNDDNSSTYRQYIEKERGVGSFWESIETNFKKHSKV